MNTILPLLMSVAAWLSSGLAVLLPKNKYAWMQGNGLQIPDDPDSALVVNTFAMVGIALSLSAVVLAVIKPASLRWWCWLYLVPPVLGIVAFFK
ncbi:MAG: hypothetical protein WCP86_03440 [bacterium]|jgi:hypothetical protein